MYSSRVVTAGVKRCLHTTRINYRSSPSPSYPSFNSPSPSRSRSRSRSRTSPPTFYKQRKVVAGGPSSITIPQLKSKLLHHISTSWTSSSSTKSSKELRQFSQSLGLDEKVLNRLVKLFSNHCLLNSPTSSSPLDDWDLQDLKNDYVTPQGSSSSQTSILSNFILIRFLSFVKTSIPLPLPNSNNTNNHTISILHELAKISDQRFFYESFPLARQSRRKIILHVGPTNSGKTYSALLALSKSRQGCYAGPLRLLAHEVFTRFNKGLIGQEPRRVCNLITGEEQKILDPEAGLTSCTVEMFPMNRKLDVGVIDEIQMLGDSQRGSAWTQTLVGSLCRELHLCGEESVVDLVSTICKELGDELIIKRYKRLSPLSVSRESLKGDLKKIKKGDCLVTFSRSNIFMFKRQIEAKTGLRVAVAYGGLPPEVREEQARAFNNGEYDVLVASDAVGMGLNLKIRRIVFESLHKWDGTAEVRLATPQIKQIAGRAGRYGVHTPVSPSAPDLDPPVDVEESETVNGEATTLDEQDLPLLRQAMQEPTVQVTRACSIPTFETFKQIFELLPQTTNNNKMSSIFSIVGQITHTSRHFRSIGTESFEKVGNLISKIKPLTFQERFTFGNSPVNLRDSKVVESLVNFVESFAKGQPILMEHWGQQVGLFDKLQEIELVREQRQRQRLQGEQTTTTTTTLFSTLFSPTTLQSLESFHRCLTLYLWLSYRLAPIFSDQSKARELRQDVEKSIEFVLEGIRFERVERGKGSKRNKAKFSTSTSTEQMNNRQVIR